ncbi:LutC/YkgG family protein [Streptacidiphilus anmyonensis]|uniref:LutC/YkgG family protein n=1 Tax=Streptacidiphilus anmyonensis TaxID=405782 RepID=UPI0005A786C7|nr:LUD domain-containing protein [Streptacidiphilus anmyonensis]
MSSRDAVLARIRAALADAPEPEPVVRDYRTAHVRGANVPAKHVPDEYAAVVDLLAENLADYRAHVHRCAEAALPALLARLLAEHGSRSVAVPPGLPQGWLAEAGGVRQHPDEPPLTARELDGFDSVVTTCRLAVAETGTLVLDAGPGQGRRALTLVPDHHICVVHTPDQVVASLPQSLARLDPTRPLTWISGPSATSDIELDRVEGVHGPRTLDVVLLE